VVRDVAKRFENRLFLSATPHNGHSNSFSALLEILDPQRFTRGVPVSSSDELGQVMVRRLKADLREIGHGSDFPERKVIQLDLAHDGKRWRLQQEGQEPRALGETDEPFELTLASLLARYKETLLASARGKRGRFIFSNLQKRLLSSTEAFYRTLLKHAEAVRAAAPTTPAPATQLDLADGRADGDGDTDEYGRDDETEEALSDGKVAQASAQLAAPEATATDLLDQMLRVAGQQRGAPDAKALALIDWIRQHQCRAASAGGPRPEQLSADAPSANWGKAASWSDRRLIVFTEFAATKRYLHELLTTAIAGTEQASERILHFHGAMGDAQREAVQQAFNSPPNESPVRILLATDAAREGVNLQGHCADLLHYDIPWNPARMEQRNGRIDRTLQPQPVVNCMYFFYPQRDEDPVLAKVVRKVSVIQRELGSLSDVVFERLGDVLEQGIDDETDGKLAAAEDLALFAQVSQKECESNTRDLDRLRQEVDEAGEILNNSRAVVDFDAALLEEAVNVGLELSGNRPLVATTTPAGQKGRAFTLPELPDSWQRTLDSMRPPRERDEELWDWRRRPPMPVVFEAPEQVNAKRVHLHLQHPFVRRVMSRFLSQGYSVHDLSRVTILRNPKDSLVRVIAFGRLSIFGHGATRLHDQLISVAAKWLESGDEGAGHLVPFGEEADRKAIEQLEQLLKDSPSLEGISPAVREKLRDSARQDYATLWPTIETEAKNAAHDAQQLLLKRGIDEAAALREILTRQKEAIEATIRGETRQLTFGETEIEKAQKRQLEHDLEHMRGRLEVLEEERKREPEQLQALYNVALTRIEPVGLVYLWPTTRG
jgi:uncharacterized membrane protein